MEEKLLSMGFDGVGMTGNIPFEPSLITLCEMNTCGNYGKCHTCPPLVGKTEELIETAKKFGSIILFQKIYPLEDSFDFEGMTVAKKDFDGMVRKVRDMCFFKLPEYIVLGAGGCSECEVCAAADKMPCRFPEKAVASLESYGIQVSSVAKMCGLKYINGQNTVTYFGGILYKNQEEGYDFKRACI